MLGYFPTHYRCSVCLPGSIEVYLTYGSSISEPPINLKIIQADVVAKPTLFEK